MHVFGSVFGFGFGVYVKALIGFNVFYFFGSVSVRFRFGFGVYVKWPLLLIVLVKIVYYQKNLYCL